MALDWTAQLARIRRMLRDPDANIWSDAFLLRAFNSEQQALHKVCTTLLETVKTIKIPPEFQMSYIHDWEWPFSDYSDGEVYQFAAYWDEDDYAYLHYFESEVLSGIGFSISEQGYRFSHPWEIYHVGDCDQMSPIPCPDNWHKMLYLAWDRKPLDPTNRKNIMSDHSFRTRSGIPQEYFRDDKISNYLYLWPRVSSIQWQDAIAGTANDDPDVASYASSGVDVDNNVTMFFRKTPTDLSAGSDESDFPAFIRKYVEYGVIAKAYKANTDGRIPSLAKYWETRRDLGVRAIQRYLGKRLSGRNMMLRTKGTPTRRQYRHSRLPDEYPPIYS
jgi:hypothetical protein